MSDELLDIRTKVSREAHQMLTAISLATGEDIVSIARTVLHAFAASERAKHTVIARVLRGEGCGGDDAGHGGDAGGHGS